jgi:hypothetical protein
MGLLDLHQTDAALEYCRKLLQIQVAEVSEYRSTDSIDGKFFRTTVRQFEIFLVYFKFQLFSLRFRNIFLNCRIFFGFSL